MARHGCGKLNDSPYFRKPLLVDMIHHNNLMVVTRRRSSRTEKQVIKISDPMVDYHKYNVVWWQ